MNLHKHNNKADPKSNIYFRDKRIRQCLINAKLIDVNGNILPPSKIRISVTQLAKERPIKEKSSKTVHNHVTEEKQNLKEDDPFHLDLSPKKKSKELKQSRRPVSSHPAPNNQRVSSPSTSKKSTVKRQKSAHNRSSDSKKLLDHRSRQPKSPGRNSGQITIIYYGSPANSTNENNWIQSDGDEIMILQQHCGGENLTVFKDYVKPNEKFIFQSHRHPDYPFALAFYINGIINCRISVCCEYKHKLNAPLGGKQGSFSIVDVKKATPCESCQRKRRKKKLRQLTSVDFEPSRYRESVVPRFSSKRQSDSSDNQLKSTSSNFQSSSKRRSPDISETPPPTTTFENYDREPLSLTSTSKSSLISTDQTSSSKTAITSKTNDVKNYESDFDEPLHETTPSSTPRHGRPCISISHSPGNQNNSDNESKESDKTPRKSDSFDDKHEEKQSENLDEKKMTGNHSRKSSSSASQASNTSEDESDDLTAKISTKKPNVMISPRSDSSHNSKKSISSPKYETKQNSNENSNHHTSSKTADDRQNATASYSKLNDDFDKLFSNRSVASNSFEDFFSNKPTSTTNRNRNNNHEDASDFWFDTKDESNTNSRNRTNFNSTSKPTSWRKNIISDEDD